MSNLKIIALAGFGNSGKSGILKGLISNLKDDSNFKLEYCLDEKNEKSDNEALFLYKSKKIFIKTSGDNLGNINRGIDEAKKRDANYLVIACHAGTNGTQIPIVKEDLFANFILKHKYENWNDLEENIQNDIKEVYTNRIKKELI